jgi:CubicO group peptidase (beta-lactamase class C family)
MVRRDESEPATPSYGGIMPSLSDIKSWLDTQLPSLLAEHGVPGAAVAVSWRGQVVDASAGVLSTATGVEATVDSVFQIGSVTKLWTATLVMQLVDEGRIDLDEPLRTYLPQFRVRDDTASATITTRHLLAHTSGIEGDVFTDTGEGADCLEKYVDLLTDERQLFAPGAMFSYNNTAYCVLGRLVEVLRGAPFDACVRDHLIVPLGLTHAVSGPYEAIMHRAAIGHLPDPDGVAVPAPVWSLPRSTAPAGAHLTMRPRDLLAFVQMHLRGGVGADGTQILSAESVDAMQQREVELPYLGHMGNAWGLGWSLYDWPGGPVIGHDGGTIGQSTFLRAVPGHDLGIALVVNGGNPFGIYRTFFTHVLGELGGVEVPPYRTPLEQAPSVDASRLAGTYSSTMAENVVSQDAEGRVWVEQVPRGIAAEISTTVVKTEIVPLGGDTFVAAEPRYGIHGPYVFVGHDGTGRARYMHTGRADPRVEGEDVPACG